LRPDNVDPRCAEWQYQTFVWHPPAREQFCDARLRDRQVALYVTRLRIHVGIEKETAVPLRLLRMGYAKGRIVGPLIFEIVLPAGSHDTHL
jgi:hypothetical protein